MLLLAQFLIASCAHGFARASSGLVFWLFGGRFGPEPLQEIWMFVHRESRAPAGTVHQHLADLTLRQNKAVVRLRTRAFLR